MGHYKAPNVIAMEALSCAHWFKTFQSAWQKSSAVQGSEALISAYCELVKSNASPVQLQACLQAAANALLKAGRLEEAELACLAWLGLARDTEKLAVSIKGATKQPVGPRERAVWLLLGKIYAAARYFEDAVASLLRAKADTESTTSASLTELLAEMYIQQGKHKVC
jgi:tetratricopeptide (TPR) repeat protein